MLEISYLCNAEEELARRKAGKVLHGTGETTDQAPGNHAGWEVPAGAEDG